MSCISQIASIGKANLNFVAKAKTSLIMYFDFYPNHLFATKDVLYITKTVAGLLITCNKCKTTLKNNSTSLFFNLKLVYIILKKFKF